MTAPGTRVVSALVRAFPRRFRERFGAELVAAYLDQRDALPGPSARARHDARTIAGLVRAIVAERVAERRRHQRHHSRLHPRNSRMSNLASDLRHAARMLRARPGFAAVAVLTLALGIGANTAVFSVLHGVVLSPLPWREPEELVRLYTASRQQPDAREFLTGADIVDVRREVDAFSSVGIMYDYREDGADLRTPDGHAERIRVLSVSADYFGTLGATPLLGRTFVREEERADARLVVLGHALWASYTGRDSSIIGRTVELNGVHREVVGVMRPTFRDLVAPDVAAWVPQDLVPGGNNSRGNYYLSAVARLAPGVTLHEAQARMDAFMRRLDELHPEDEPRITRVLPLHADIVGQTSSALYLLMGAAALVLLIACLNVANLFLARSVSQSRETAVRCALGAGRARLVAERLTEACLVALTGGLVGTATAYWGVRALLAVSPESLARAEDVQFDPLLLAFALALTLVTGLVFGAAPALRATRVDPNQALHEGSRGNTSGRGSRRTRSFLVGSQVAVALVLLVGAGTLIRAFAALQRIPLGIEASGVTTFEVNLPVTRYDSAARRVQFHTDFTERLRALPGVSAVGATSWLPANGDYHRWGASVLNERGERLWRQPQVRVIDGDLLPALGIPLLAGRAFGPEERLGTAGTALVSRSLARAAYGDRDPVGQVLRTGGHDYTVIGVVGDVAALASGDLVETVYLSHDQFAGDRNWSLTYAVKAMGEPEALLEAARGALASIDPALVLHRPRTMEAVLAQHRARDRFVLLLMSVFGAVALSLAAVGVYGVLSYVVSQRVHEIGVRMALGARSSQLRGLVIGQGMRVAGAGAVAGLIGAVALGGVLQALVPNVAARDPVVLAAAVLVLAVTVALAAYLPARRATSVNPLQALHRD